MENKKIKKSDFEKILQSINDEIFNGQLTDIIEVTYAYKKMSCGNYWNETLFWYFAGFRFDYSHDLEQVSKITSQKLKKKIAAIDKFLKKLQKITYKSKQESIKSKILIWSLKYSRNCLEIALLWLPFELSKAWFDHGYTQKEAQTIVKQIEKLEKKNFWWKISHNQDELVLAYNYILKVFKDWKWLLNSDEQKEFKNTYIKAIKNLLDPTKELYRVKYYATNKLSKEAEEKLAANVTRWNYTKIFKTVLNDILWLDFEVVHEERSSIYDGPWFLSFPSSKTYDSMTLRRVIELIGHEIEVHCFNYRMNQRLLWNFRWAWNLEKEEGFAMTVEEFLKWKKLEDITVTRHFVIVLASEVFELEELKWFMRLYSKMTWKKYMFQHILRQKRNYPLECKWGQHKDVTYGRWIQKVLDFLKNGWDMRELYLWKISLDDIPKAKKLLKYSGRHMSDLNIPIFFGELILYLAITPPEKSNCDHFLKMLKKKYHFINFDKLDLLIVKEFVKVKVSFDRLKLV